MPPTDWTRAEIASGGIVAMEEEHRERLMKAWHGCVGKGRAEGGMVFTSDQRGTRLLVGHIIAVAFVLMTFGLLGQLDPSA